MKFKTWFVISAFLLALALPAAAKEPPYKLPKKSDLKKLQSAVIKTSKGTLFVELYPEDAPWHVANFKYLADAGFYQDSFFHIFQSDYIIQGGGHPRNPRADAGWSLPPEFNERAHEYGALGMARKEDLINPDRSSSSSQFHMLLRRAPHMDGRYTIFGRVVAGYQVLQALRKGDRIEDVVVYVRDPKKSPAFTP